ncbi:MAG: hypothetical protein HYT76_05580 [Deltaproteobacteria bacterium]|nr:hypothetical protein [Deltaproteobacteria bacterium]
MSSYQAKRLRGVRLRVQDHVGELGRILSPLAEAHINVEAINTFHLNDWAYLDILTSDNEKAEKLWEKHGYHPEEFDVISIELNNKAGELAAIATKLGQAGIDIRYLYTSAQGQVHPILLLSTNNNEETLKLLKK